MTTEQRRAWFAPRWGALTLLILLAAPGAKAHVVPPEQFHPVVESYRRAMFLLNLNPVLWEEVQADAARIATGLETLSKARAAVYRQAVAEAVAKPMAPVKDGGNAPGPDVRREAARILFEASTRAIAELLGAELEALKASTGNRAAAEKRLDLARQYWSGFEHEVKATDPPMFREIGLCWLKMSSALGSAPLMGLGEIPVDARTIREEADEILAYVKTSYGDFKAPPAPSRPSHTQANPLTRPPSSPRSCRPEATSTNSARVRARSSTSWRGA